MPPTDHDAKCASLMLLGELGERLGAEVLREPSHILDFLSQLLAMYASRVQAKSHSEQQATSTVDTSTIVEDDSDEELLALVLAVLSTVLSGAVALSRDDVPRLDRLVPSLSALSNHNESQISELASAVHVSIVTRDGSWRRWATASSACEAMAPQHEATELETVLELLRDRLIPIRASGLVELVRLARERHHGLEPNLDKVLGIFRQQLNHSDPYLFLTAITGLVHIAAIYPAQVVTFVVDALDDSRISLDARVKLTESVAKLAAMLNDTLPTYIDALVGRLFFLTNHTCSLTQSSALSALASLIAHAKWAVLKYAREAFECGLALSSAKDTVVRRAAVALLSSLAQSLGAEWFATDCQLMVELLRRLRCIEASDDDDRVGAFAADAIMAIDKFARQSFEIGLD